MKVVLDAIFAPDSFEEELEEIILAWFEENWIRPLSRAFYVDRPNSVDEIDVWEEFPSYLDSLNYPRSSLPQIRGDDRDALVSYLRSRGIECVMEFLPAENLKPTQALFSHAKVAAARNHSGGDRPILASNDLRILDGHHQWFATYIDNPGLLIPVLTFDARIQRLIREANSFPETERQNEARENAVPDYGELVAALNSGRIKYAESVFSGKFSAQTSKILRGLGAKFNSDAKTYVIAQDLIPHNLRGTLAMSKARSLELTTSVVDTAAELGAKIASSPTIALKLAKFTDKLVDNLEAKFLDSLTAANESTPAIETVATPPDFTPAEVQDVRETLTENLSLAIKNFTDVEVGRIRSLAEENYMNGGRVDRLQDIIQRRFEVTRNKARFLARQETSMVASEFARARAQSIGSTEYVWHTRHDDRVRHDHQELNGTTQMWDDPPVVDKADDRRANPGMDYNCRCVAQPILNLQARRIA